MVIVSVNFKLSNDVSRSDLKSKFLETAPMYQTTAGLIRKNYLYDEERHVVEAFTCLTLWRMQKPGLMKRELLG